MEKYGFVYIWYDRKHKRFYVGSHWGNEDDGYICSSSWMKQAYKHRPYDFKRRILKSNIMRSEMLTEEYKWLSLIKESELGKKYYNLTNHHPGHWTLNENKDQIARKCAWLKNKKLSDTHKKNISKSIRKSKKFSKYQKNRPEEHQNKLLLFAKNRAKKGINKGMIYITNGIINTMVCPDKEIPAGWFKGRTISNKHRLSLLENAKIARNSKEKT